MADEKDPQDEAAQRRRERHESREEIFEYVERLVDDMKYPTNSAEIRTAYRDSPDEIVAEEESLGSALDRLDDEYEDEVAAREAIMEELGEAEHAKPAETTEKETAEVERETTGVVDEVDEDEEPDTE